MEWKEIPGHPGYQISSTGLVQSKNGQLLRPCKPGGSTTTYYQTTVNGDCVTFSLRRLIPDVFGFEWEEPEGWHEQLRAELGYGQKKARPSRKPCFDCNRPMPSGYWRRCPKCWAARRADADSAGSLPLDEYRRVEP